ncbi:MAG: ABC transporter substrate-binding protein [Thermoleophilia bacterium]|nr:ABC transporter substrate-binding protein [Thermoleophilia bacterium]
MRVTRDRAQWGFVVLLALSVIGLMLFVAACGEKETTTTGGATTASSASTSTSAPSTETTGAGSTETTGAAAGDIEEVAVAVSLEPQSLDPTSSKFNPMNYPVLANIFDALVSVNNTGQPDMGKGVAESWTISPDGLTIEFKLKEGIKFHSGDPLTAADVVFSHERAVANNPEYGGLFAQGFDHVEAVDDRTVKFVFTKPNVLFMYSAAPHLYLVSKAYYDRVGEQEFVAKPVGTGPYKFVEWKTGEYLDLVRFDEYWGQKPAVVKGHMVFVPDPMTRVQMLQAGEVNLVDTTPWDQVNMLKEKGFNVAILDSAPSISVQFHTKNPKAPWGDVRVRKAIALAIDKESIQKDLFHGVPGLNAWPADWEVGYNPELQPYPFDLEQAKKLMAEAGYANGFKMPLYYPMMGAEMQQAAEAVSLYLQALKITCDVQALEMGKMMESMRTWAMDPNAQVVIIMGPLMRGSPDPIIGLQRQFYGKNPMGMYENPQVDADIEQALVTYDNTKRGQLIADAFKRIYEDVAVAPIVAGVVAYATSPDLVFTPAACDPAVLYLKNIARK